MTLRVSAWPLFTINMADVDTPATNGEKETRAKDTINTPGDVSEEDKQYLVIYLILSLIYFLRNLVWAFLITGCSMNFHCFVVIDVRSIVVGNLLLQKC